jgi:hypothetical protein
MNKEIKHRITCLFALRNVGKFILGQTFPEELVVLIIRNLRNSQFFDVERLKKTENPCVLSEENSLGIWRPKRMLSKNNSYTYSSASYSYDSCFNKVAVPLNATLSENDIYQFTISFEVHYEKSDEGYFGSSNSMGWCGIGFVDLSYVLNMKKNLFR